jgi:tight adherence protein C
VSGSALLAGFAAAAAVVGLGDFASGAAKGQRRLGRGWRRRSDGAGSRGPALLRLLATIGARFRAVAGARAPASLATRIAAAGSPAGFGPREVMAAKLAGALAAAPPGALFGAAAPGRLGPLFVAGAPLAGFFAPDLWLTRRVRARAREVRRDLPALLDLLRVSVEAGLSPAAALRGVAERGSGPVAAEWGTVAREVALGVPLATALERSATRVPLPEVRELYAAIARATRHGAPLGRTLAAHATEARAARRRRIEEEAARAGPKIQLVVALLLVPSVLLLVAAALAAALLGGEGTLPVGP